MTKYTIIVNDTDETRTRFRVHKEKCRDIEMEKRRLKLESYDIEGLNAEDAIEKDIWNYQKDDQFFNKSNYVKAPCLKGDH